MSEVSSSSASETSSSSKVAENGDAVKETNETKNIEAESSETKYDQVADSQSQVASGGNLGEIKQENADSASETAGESESDDGFFDAPEGDEQSEGSEESEGVDDADTSTVQEDEQKTGLTEEQKNQIREETGWSDEIIDAISSMEEYEVYKKAGLVEAEINSRPCLINPNIDMEQKDAFGRTNKERMEQGLAPLDENGKPIELHHIGQHADSPLAELTQEQHRIDNYSILHDAKKESEIDRPTFDQERQDHWKARAEGENK